VADENRLEQLISENAQLRGEAKDRRIKGKRLREENEALKGQVANLTTERDGYKLKSESSAPELTSKVAELEGVIRMGKHRKAFDEAAAKAGARPDAMDDLWTLSGYKSDSPEPDPSVIAEAIERTQGSKSYLFKPAEAETGTEVAEVVPPGGSPPPKLKLPLDESRGGGNLKPLSYTVTAAQYGDPTWMMQNGHKIAEAQKAGNLVFAP
jgi:hypothetical protein